MVVLRAPTRIFHTGTTTKQRRQALSLVVGSGGNVSRSSAQKEYRVCCATTVTKKRGRIHRDLQRPQGPAAAYRAEGGTPGAPDGGEAPGRRPAGRRFISVPTLAPILPHRHDAEFERRRTRLHMYQHRVRHPTPRPSSNPRIAELPRSRTLALQIRLQSGQESAWVSQSPFMRPAHEPSQRPFREVRPILRRERGKATSAPVHRTLRHIRHLTPATHAPSRVRPAHAACELAVVPIVVTLGRGEPSSDPFRHRHRHRVADQTPPVAALSYVPQHRCPPCGEALETLDGLYCRQSDASARQKYSRGRRNTQARAGLERRYGVCRQSMSGPAFSPVESDRPSQIQRRPLPFRGVIGKQYVTGVAIKTGDDVHAPAPLRQPEGATVDYPRGPPIAQTFKARHDVFHRRPSREMQHEIDVLDHHPRCRPHFEQPEQSVHHSRFVPFEPLLLPGHRQILARESRCHDIRFFRQGRELGHVRITYYMAKPMPNNTQSIGVNLTHQQGSVT